jgi:hypothetical protein
MLGICVAGRRLDAAGTRVLRDPPPPGCDIRQLASILYYAAYQLMRQNMYPFMYILPIILTTKAMYLRTRSQLELYCRY